MKLNDIETEVETAAAKVEVLIIYDQISVGIHAKALCEHLLPPLGTQYELQLNFWKLNLLENPAWPYTAAALAARPALLIVAINGAQPLSPLARNWIAHCARRMPTPGGAIVALFHGIIRMNLELAPAHSQLKSVAEKTNRQFFSEAVTLTDQELDTCIQEIHRRARLHTNVLAALPVTA